MQKFRTAAFVYKQNGVKGIFQIIQEKQRKLIRTFSPYKIKFLVKNEDVINCDWDNSKKEFKTNKKSGPYIFNWVMSPPGKGSGGHQNIFRFISFLEEAGHTCRIYLYTSGIMPSLEVVNKNISSGYTKVNAQIKFLEGEMEQADAIFATGWETAYPVYNQQSPVKRFYFIQDYEPYFYTIGSEFALAENTYKFGFTGITAGKWLTQKLTTEYSMNCDFYDFGVDSGSYMNLNHATRKKVFFYARPVTSRRGFELGILALEKFHNENPDIEIVMAGWDVSDFDVPFPFVNLGVCHINDLPEIYNECAAALILSFSNLSLLPLELLSCGVIPVLNKGLNNELVSDNEYIKYCEPTPGSLSKALSDIVNNDAQVDLALKASESVRMCTWEDAGKKFLEIIEKEIHE
ncbi:MAG: glycosyltransferase family 1 protein [Acidimicrobiia bacterium]